MTDAPNHATPNRAQPDRALPSPTIPGRTLANPAVRDEYAPYLRKVERVLNRMGGAYLLGDILKAIDEGKMQSFAHRNSWCVTQLSDFPRARKLNVVLIVGDLEDRDAIMAKLVEYAAQQNASLISGLGRLGWWPGIRELGWRVRAKSFLYEKEM